MFKKNLWIVGLLMAVTMAFIGCIDPPAAPEGEIMEVFNLAKHLETLDVGDISSDEAFGAAFGGTPIDKCGAPKYEIAMEGGKKVFKISGMKNTWGEGFDIYNTSGANHIGAMFTTGDEIYIKGSADTGKAGVVLAVSNSSYAGPGWNSNDDGGAFDRTITLSDADIGNIKASGVGQPAIRVQYSGGGGSRQGTIVFEQLTITGTRPIGWGPEAPPPPPAPHNPECRVPDCPKGDACDNKLAKTYTVPDGGLDYFYMNLNDWESKGATMDGITYVTGATLAAAKITVPFTANTQRVAFKFTDEQFVRVLDSGAIKFEIVGTATPDHQFRYHLGDVTATGNWNATAGAGGTAAVFSALLDVGVLAYTPNFGVNSKYLMIQKREAGNSSVEITSIKVTLSPATKLATVAMTIPVPEAGKTAPTSVDGTGFTGEITWVPAIDDSEKWALSTVYYANVAVKAKPGYSIAINATATVNSDPAYINPATKLVTSDYFPRTAAKIPLIPIGKAWSLSDWIVKTGTITDTGYWWYNARPLQYNNQTGGAAGVTFEGSGATAIMVSCARTAAYHGWDFYLNSGHDIALDPVFHKMTVTVKGTITTADADTEILIEMADSPYTKLIQKKVGAGSNVAFNETSAEIPQTFPIDAKLRIHTNQTGEFKVSYLQFDVTGHQPQ